MASASPVTAYIGLGSNLGDRALSLFTAVAHISRGESIQLVRISSVIETRAIGGPPGSPDFLNAVAQIQTTLGSHALLKRLLEIEHSLGRQRRVKWEPRTIDLDILLYGQEIISSDELIIPHPLMHERRFVLQPLAEIAPEVVHPVLQMTARGLLDNLKA